jgi:hypothetical protein
MIEPAKLRDYLLSPRHPIGRFKARFFAALGFSPERWQELDGALRIQHLTQNAEPAGFVAMGQKFTIRAILNGPNGAVSGCRQRVVHPVVRGSAALCDRISGREPVSFRPLDVVVLQTDQPAQGLKRGDLGAIVDIYSPDAIDVEFVTASGRTKALVTLKASDIREVGDDDLVTVRPTSR